MKSTLFALALMAASPLAAIAQATTPPPTTAAPKVLRYAFKVAETGFDPARVNDLYSRMVTPHIFEGLYGYDHLARPAIIKPRTALGMPQVSDDFRTYTVRIKPGIYFADDPAFKGQRRELVAADYVYAFKRYADPATKSPNWGTVDQAGLIGLSTLRKQSIEQKKPFDYDTPIEGLKVIDRYTIQFNTERPRPRFIELIATGDLFGAVAREVVETYGDLIPAHPVGTGPFKLTQWRRNSLIVLERNPNYREVYYDAEPAADDAQGQALLARFKGRRLPMIDRVEISIVEEEQPRWLSFLNQQHDLIEELPFDFINVAMPKGRVAPNLAKQGIYAQRAMRAEIQYHQFNLEDPVIGGYTPERIALRRALSLSYDSEREIRLVWKSQGVPAHQINVPHTVGYTPGYKSEAGEYSPAKARALLDMHGYIDRNGDGWREQPNGEPLTITKLSQPDALTRQHDELLKKAYTDIGVRLAFKVQKWPENLKASRAGNYQMWRLGGSAAAPDGQTAVARLHGKQIGGQNMARVKVPAIDALYERMEGMPHGPERLAMFDELKRLAAVYVPYRPIVHRYMTDMFHPWVVGYRRTVFWQDWWQMIDIDVNSPAVTAAGVNSPATAAGVRSTSAPAPK